MANAADAAAMAYKVPSDILRSIGRVESPFEKIRCVLNALREINSRVQCFFNARGQTKPVEMFVFFFSLVHIVFNHLLMVFLCFP